MLKIVYTSKFKKDYKKIKKRGYNLKLLEEVLNLLIYESPLPQKYNDHELIGNYVNFRELHITPDWLLVYKIDDDTLVLTLIRTGTHSDLFN